MKKMTHCVVGLLFVLAAFISANAEMKTMGEKPKFFEDDFDTPKFSEKNWIINVPRWDYIVIDETAEPVDIGFRGRYILEDTTAIADGGIFYLSENLYIKTDLLTFYAEIFEPGHPRPKDQGGAVFIFDFFSDRYVAAQLFYSGDVWLHSAGYGGEGAGTEKIVFNVNFGEFYCLDLSIDENRQITSRIINESGEMISIIEGVAVPEMDFGMVGIGSQSDVVFNNFIFNAREHPDACYFNLDFDSDVDGRDAAAVIQTGSGVLETFAAGFGMTDCLDGF